MNVAVVVKKFPVLSETFVINHIISLINAGIKVSVLSYEQNEIHLIHPLYFKEGLDKITTYGVKAPVNKFTRFTTFFKLLYSEYLPYRKLGILKTLNFFRYGKQALNLDLFYKAQIVKSKQEFDIIHCHFGPIGDDIRKLRELGLISGKLVVSFHGYDFLKKNVLLSHNFYKDLFKSCNGIIANSSFTKGRLIELGCASNKIEIIPVIPNNDIFESKIKEDKEQSKGVFKILTVARLEEVKGIKYGIESVSLLKNKYNISVQYDIVGGGRLFNELQHQIGDLQMEDTIILHGPKVQEQVAYFYQNADIFLLPSIMETQGLVLLEAQMNSLPIVATKTGGIPDSILENKTGLLVETKNAAALAEALLQFCMNHSLKVKFGEEGKKFVSMNFNPKRITDKMLTFYKKL